MFTYRSEKLIEYRKAPFRQGLCVWQTDYHGNEQYHAPSVAEEAGNWILTGSTVPLSSPSIVFDFVVVLFEASSCRVDRTQWNVFTQTMEMYPSTPSSTLWESNLKAVCALSPPLGFRYLLCFGQRIDQSLFLCVCVMGWGGGGVLQPILKFFVCMDDF